MVLKFSLAQQLDNNYNNQPISTRKVSFSPTYPTAGDTLVLSCIVRAYPPPTAKIIKLNEDTLNSVDDNHDLDLVRSN